MFGHNKIKQPQQRIVLESAPTESNESKKKMSFKTKFKIFGALTVAAAGVVGYLEIEHLVNKTDKAQNAQIEAEKLASEGITGVYKIIASSSNSELATVFYQFNAQNPLSKSEETCRVSENYTNGILTDSYKTQSGALVTENANKVWNSASQDLVERNYAALAATDPQNQQICYVIQSNNQVPKTNTTGSTTSTIPSPTTSVPSSTKG